MKKPVVVSRTAALQWYFTKDMVQFFEPENVEMAAKAIIELARDPKKRKLKAKNIDLFNSKQNWDYYKRSYFNILNQISGIGEYLL